MSTHEQLIMLSQEDNGNTQTNKRRGEDNMKFGEIIDYMMENEIVSTIKTNDGKIDRKSTRLNSSH